MYREDVVLFGAYVNGWINVIVDPIPESGDVRVSVEWQSEFDAEPVIRHSFESKPTLSALKVHYWRLGGSEDEKRLAFAAILRCVGKARAELRQETAV